MLVTSSACALDLQGHRGARGLLPENTLPAFERALELGVTTLELDCGVTQDGIVVISHDRTLNPDIVRDAAGRWLDPPTPALRELTLEALQRYDVGRLRPGTAYAKRFSRQHALDGTHIPTLEALFDLVRTRGDTRIRFNIETKLSPVAAEETVAPEVFVRAVLGVIHKARVEKRVTIQSFDWRTLRLVQSEAPGIPTAYLSAERTSPHNVAPPSQWTAGFQVSDYGGSLPRTIKAAGGTIWSPYHADLTQEALREAQALGLKVIAWTVNSEPDMRRLLEWGVDGIISDYPDLLAEVALKRRAR
jgi:glycerophosphoryl diester phosphodiesterase